MHKNKSTLKEKSKKREFIQPYTLGEEIANSITHGIAAGLSVAGLVALLVFAARHGDVYQVVSFSIFGASMIILYLASTLYHSFQVPRLKKWFQILDHASIFLLIAGTYTPFLLVGIRGKLGWALLIIIWGLALLGMSFKILFIDRFQKISVLAYVLMGWLSLAMFKELWANISPGGLILLAVGGVVYTVGVIFYAGKKIPYNHAIWHLFVMGGSICHYFAVLLYLSPAR